MQEEDEKQPESNESDRMKAHTQGNYQRGNYQRNNQPYGGGNYSPNRGSYSGGNDRPNDRSYPNSRNTYSDRQPRPGGTGGGDNRPYGNNRTYDNRSTGNSRPYPPRQDGYSQNRSYDNRSNDGRSGGYKSREGGGGEHRRSYDNNAPQRGGYDRRPSTGDRNPRYNSGGKPSYKQKNEPLQPKPKVRTITLVKALCRLDYGSPKLCLQQIQSGKVYVNDILAKDQNVPIVPYKEKIVVDGVVVQQKQKNVYIVMHKPRGISGSIDKSDSIFQMLRHNRGWFFPLGCLDRASSGIVVITNDPSHKDPAKSPFRLLEKEYWVKVHKVLTPKQIAQLELTLCKDLNETVKIDLASANTRNTVISISVFNSTPSQIRTCLKKLDLETMSFERRRFSSVVTTETLRSGSWRQLNIQEIRELMGDVVEMQEYIPSPEQVKTVNTVKENKEDSTSTPTSKWQKLKKQLLGG
ncbi:MAG: hypothetical protein HYZ54_13175 [Ignavibacteriae bacterium]|nr:hypothetical protein [Ignavibacteriota bacterium]